MCVYIFPPQFLKREKEIIQIQTHPHRHTQAHTYTPQTNTVTPTNALTDTLKYRDRETEVGDADETHGEKIME